MAKAQASSLQKTAANAQQLAYQATIDSQASSIQAATLVYSQIEQQMIFNGTIQTLLQDAQNQTPSALQCTSQIQMLVCKITTLITQLATQVQSIVSLAVTLVSENQALLEDMNTAASSNTTNSSQSVSLSQFAQEILNKTQQAVASSLVQESTGASMISSESNALRASLQAELEILELQTLVSQQTGKSLMQQANLMTLMILNVTNALYLQITQAKKMQQSMVQVNLAQSIAVQATINMTRLALCYPNPCMHGGMCAVNFSNISFTCFCSQNYQGSLIE